QSAYALVGVPDKHTISLSQRLVGDRHNPAQNNLPAVSPHGHNPDGVATTQTQFRPAVHEVTRDGDGRVTLGMGAPCKLLAHPAALPSSANVTSTSILGFFRSTPKSMMRGSTSLSSSYSTPSQASKTPFSVLCVSRRWP